MDEIGRQQAAKLGRYFEKHPVEAVFCSPLCRSRETASIISGGVLPVLEKEKLTELYMGEWENLPFQELKKIRNGIEQEPLQGEGRRVGKYRIEHAIQEILEETKEDVAVVAHAGVNCCFLSGILGVPLEVSRQITQPYGGISKVIVDENGGLQIDALGRKPEEVPDRAECEEMWEHYGTPEQVRRHCIAVADVAVRLGKMLLARGRYSEETMNLDLIESAALLHDVARSRSLHAEEGAKILIREGYPEVADIIRQHHQLDGEVLDEAAIVYLADKLVYKDQEVTLRERFAQSEKKCKTPEAMQAHDRRLQQAEKIRKMFLAAVESSTNNKIQVGA